jgi:hypothetical protein
MEEGIIQRELIKIRSQPPSLGRASTNEMAEGIAGVILLGAPTALPAPQAVSKELLGGKGIISSAQTQPFRKATSLAPASLV